MSFEAAINAKLATTTPPAAKTPEPAPEPDESGVDDAPEPDESDADDAPEPDESDAPEPDEDGSDNEDGHEGEPSAAGERIDLRKNYLVNGKVLTGKQLQAGLLMQEDYTRKTQRLAEARKASEAKSEELEGELEDVLLWAKGLSNPVRMEYELAENYPEAFAALKDRIIEQALEESELAQNPRALEHYRRARQADLEAEARKAQEEFERNKTERTARRAQTAELKANFAKWEDAAMKEAGLSTAEERTLVQDRLIAGHRDTKWTAETFLTAAKAVAKMLGKAKPAKPAAQAKPTLPAVRPLGHKPPPAQVAEQRAAKAKAERPASFDALRKKYGLA